MAEGENIKQFLHSWLGTNKHEQPNYAIRPTGPLHRQRFLCELRVPNFDYVAAGNSTNKKDAQANSAKDFCSFLVRSGLMRPEEMPGSGDSGPGTPQVPQYGGAANLGLTNRAQPMFNEGFGPKALGEAYQMRDQQPGQGDFKRDFLDKMNKKNMEEAEDVDPNAAIHGNWTMENAKSFLHQFIQTRNIRTDYIYSRAGNSFVAEMSFYVKELSRNINGREAASQKQSASKSCALSLVRQLFHLGVIEAFSGTLKKNKSAEEIKPYEVSVNGDIVNQVEECLRGLDMPPVLIDAYTGGEGAEPLSLLTHTNLEHMLPPSTALEAGIISWSPPTDRKSVV